MALSRPGTMHHSEDLNIADWTRVDLDDDVYRQKLLLDSVVRKYGK